MRTREGLAHSGAYTQILGLTVSSRENGGVCGAEQWDPNRWAAFQSLSPSTTLFLDKI